MLRGDWRKSWKKKDKSVRLDLEAAFEAFNDAPAEIKTEVRAVVAPVAKTLESGRVSVDVKALKKRAEIIERLIDIHERLERLRFEEEDEQDIEFLLRNL